MEGTPVEVGEDYETKRLVESVYIPYEVEEDNVHTDIARWQLREVRRNQEQEYVEPVIGEPQLYNYHSDSVGNLLGLEAPMPPVKTVAEDLHLQTVDEKVSAPRIGADWPVAQFARKFREEVFKGRSSEKYSAVSFTQNLTLAGRTSKLELEMDTAIQGTIKQYTTLRKEYIKQRDGLPLDFLRFDVKDGKGLVYVRERATARIYKWMDRILRHRIRRRYGTWVKLVLWYRWVQKCKRGILKVERAIRRRGLRYWKVFTLKHREAERFRASIMLQKVFRGHAGRQIAYKRMRVLAAHAIQMRVRMFFAVIKTIFLRRRREGAKAMQRLVRWRRFRQRAALIMQTWYRMRRNKNEFMAIKESTRKICEKWLASFLMRTYRAQYMRKQLGACIVSKLWRGKVARKRVHRMRSARIVQAQWRGRLARWKVFHMFRVLAVCKIQPTWRGHIGRRAFKLRRKGQVCIQKYFLMWTALRRYKIMIASRNRAKKKARIRVSVRPIHGVQHIVAAVRPGRVEWKWSKEPGLAPTAKAVWVTRRGLEIQAFRVTDGVDYKIEYTHEQLQERWEMYRKRGKRTPGAYSKPFLNLLFDQLKVSPYLQTAQIVRTTRTERGKKISGFSHWTGTAKKKRWFVVTVWLYNEEYCWRAFDPKNQKTYRGTVMRRELEKRLQRYDAFEDLSDSDVVFPIPSKKALAWILRKMVVYDQYAMQAFWKSPVYGEGVLILDQQEDVMAMKIQGAYRQMVARGVLYDKIKNAYRKMWDKSYQSYYYFHNPSQSRSWELPLLLYRTNRWDLEVVDIWDRIDKGTDGVWYFNGARDRWSRYSEAEAAEIIRKWFLKYKMGDTCSLPSLSDLAKGMKFKDMVLDAYDRHPEKLSAIVNMALYAHTRTHQYDVARKLYKQALKLSDANPTILYSVGLFELADRNFRFQDSRWSVAMDYLADAKELDTRRDKFATAETMFFKFSVIIGSNDPRSLRNWALVHQCIKEDFTTADKLFCRSLSLDPYDEGTQVCYVDFLREFQNGGKYDRAGPPLSLKASCKFVREETIDGQQWQLWSNPNSITKAHRRFWFNVEQARTRWVSPKWKARGFLPMELQIMKGKRRIVTAEKRYKKQGQQNKAKRRNTEERVVLKPVSGDATGPSSPTSNSANDVDTDDDIYHGSNLADLLGAAPGSPVHSELTAMQNMLSSTSQRLMQLEASQSNQWQPTVDELERLKSMVQEQNARMEELMARQKGIEFTVGKSNKETH